jgi:NMD protein affecting ribosome stability and mRNA decay|tara:strand:+ start:303 stop:515 length:213 start_codon:yes stop_codon:yes gene_type:complete
MSICDRCPKPTNITKMSWFNIDNLCDDCQRQEESHPDFAHAKAVEHEAVCNGDTNFPGVGWPGAEGRVPR